MVEFLRSLGNLLGIAVTILGIFAIFFKALTPITASIILGIILLLGFISLIIYQISKIENRIIKLEEKYKRTEELSEIRSEIKLLKSLIERKMNKKRRLTSEDALEIIRIVIILIIGYIIVKAILSTLS